MRRQGGFHGGAPQAKASSAVIVATSEAQSESRRTQVRMMVGGFNIGVVSEQSMRAPLWATRSVVA